MKYHSAVSLSVSPAKPSRPLLRLHTTKMAASPEPGQTGTPQPAAAETGSDPHELLASGRPLPQPILGAVVDLDGTLLDSEPIYFQCYKHAAGRCASQGNAAECCLPGHAAHCIVSAPPHPPTSLSPFRSFGVPYEVRLGRGAHLGSLPQTSLSQAHTPRQPSLSCAA